MNFDACAVPTPEQIEQMESGLGVIFTPRMALELGMQTAIGNVKRAYVSEQATNELCTYGPPKERKRIWTRTWTRAGATMR
jgi:hypothetical protein